MGKWVHRLTEINEESRTGVCANCGPVRLKADKGRWRCRVAARMNRGNTAAKIRRPHGLTLLEAAEYRAGKSCEICGSTVRLCVDHDHSTGVIRGVLCTKCNAGLGMFLDDPKLMLSAADYISKRALTG